jgi:molybdate transport system substrate-binding protein
MLEFMSNLKTLRLLPRAVCIALAGLCAFGTLAQAETVTVFAAASLKGALDEVAQSFEDNFDHTITLSYGGSSALARQISYGAPANLFISANPQWMDDLEARGLLQAQTRVDLLSNDLVLIAPTETTTSVVLTDVDTILTALNNGPLAMGFVEAVPAGIYGKAALTSLGLWGALAPHVAQTDSVRSALALVARSEAPLGVVYGTDALAEPRVQVVARFPKDSHPPITYPVAIIAPASKGAEDFASFLASQPALEVFQAYGFGQAVP